MMRAIRAWCARHPGATNVIGGAICGFGLALLMWWGVIRSLTT